MTGTPEQIYRELRPRLIQYDPIGASMPVRQIKVPLVELLVVSLVIGCVPFGIGLAIAWARGL